VFPARYTNDVELDGSVYRAFTKEIKLNTNGTDTAEWTKTYSDGAGRPYKTVYAAASGAPASQTVYNDSNQAWKQADPDNVTTLRTYNSKGEQEYTIVAMSDTALALSSYDDLLSGLATLKSGTDRITQRTQSVVAASGVMPDLLRSDILVWKDGSSTGTLVSRSEVSTDGLRSWQTLYPNSSTNLVSKSRTVYPGSGNRYITNSAADGSYSVSAYSYGRPSSVTRFDALGSQLSATVYGYDPHGRQNTMTDARNGTTTVTFNNADQPISVTTPPPGTGQSAQTTTTYYNTMLQATNVVQPDGASVFTEYFLTGLRKKTYGSRTYPVEYSHDYYSVSGIDYTLSHKKRPDEFPVLL
jgi:hypothetical protein